MLAVVHTFQSQNGLILTLNDKIEASDISLFQSQNGLILT